MITACIFDLDGVIVDTAVYHYRAWKRLANQLGFDFTEAQNEKLKGVSRARSLELILEWGGIRKTAEEQEALATLKNQWYVEMISHMTPQEILPGALSFLEAVRAEGMRTALGSASRNSRTILERTGLLPYFDAIVDGNAVTASKPDPEVFLKCAAALQTAPAHCMVFEDAIAGVAAAKAAGMKVTGIGEAEVLKDADLVVPGLQHMTVNMLNNA